MRVVRRIALAVLIAIPICHSAAAAGSEFDGLPVEVISTMPPLRFCSVYGLEQDCSLVAGVQRQVPSLPKRIVVAGSADGTKVYVGFGLWAVLNMRPGEIDAAAATVNDIGKSIDAKLLKVEVFAPKALISTGSVWVSFDGTLPVGALLTFDRDVYTMLKIHPGGVRARSGESGDVTGTAGAASAPIPSEQQ
jgi:hypothetical protein